MCQEGGTSQHPEDRGPCTLDISGFHPMYLFICFSSVSFIICVTSFTYGKYVFPSLTQVTSVGYTNKLLNPRRGSWDESRAQGDKKSLAFGSGLVWVLVHDEDERTSTCMAGLM